MLTFSYVVSRNGLVFSRGACPSRVDTRPASGAAKHLLLIRHQDDAGFVQAGDRFEGPVRDLFSQLRDRAEVLACGPGPRETTFEVLAQHIGGCANDLV